MNKISFETKKTNVSALKRAAYKFTDLCAVELKQNNDITDCIFRFKAHLCEEDFKAFEIEFRNEVLDEELRLEISEQTESVRNLILAYAFSETGITDDV